MKKAKGILSTILMVGFAVSLVTGTILFFNKTGMIGIVPRKYMSDIHAVSSFVVAACVIPHIIGNLRLYLSEMKSGRKSK